MLARLIRWSIDNAGLVLVIAGVLLVAAGVSLPRMPVDVFPELNAPTVVVLTESPGLAADEVEQYVTFPIETALNGVPGRRRVRSSSGIGLSLVWVEFGWGTDIYRARQMVSERLDSVRDALPPEAHSGMTPITSITGEIMLLGVSSPGGDVSDLDLRTYAEFDLRNKLLAIPGVAQVSVIGGELAEYQVLVEQDELLLYGLAMHDIVEAAGASHTTQAAGYLPDVQGLELPIRQTGRVRSVDDIKATIVKYHEGVPLTLGDVADVRVGPAPRRGTGAEGGRPAVVLTVQKAPGTNTLAVTGAVDEALDGLADVLPEGIAINRQVFRQSDFINLSVSNVLHALRDAAVIVAVILVIFLLNARSTIITLTALPLSLAVGLLVLAGMGMSINVMTLGGFAIAVGSLVDDAIIDVENVFRRLRQNAALPEDVRKRRSQVVFDASNEIRPAMVFATVIIALVFVPLMFLDGIEGRFFRPLGVAFVVSLLASLAVALTVTPAMCMVLMRHPGAGRAGDGFVVRGLKRVYEPLLRGALAWRRVVLLGAALTSAASLWLGSTFGSSFLPEFNEGTFTVFLSAPPGTSLAASDRLARNVEAQLVAMEGVRSVTRRTGRSERDEHAEPVSNSEIEVTVAPGFRKADMRARIRTVLDSVPGITTSIGQPIEHRLSHILSGTPAAIAINVYGDDLDVLRATAKEIEGILEAIPGTQDVLANREVMVESLPVRYRVRDLAAYGITPADAALQVRDAMYGATVEQINDGAARIDLTVRLTDEERDSIDDLRGLLLKGCDGAIVRLEEVADIGKEMASNLIIRENAQRKAVVSLNVADGYNLGQLVGAVREQVDPVVARAGCTVSYGGQFEAQASAARTILGLGAVTLAIMLMLLRMAVGTWRIAILVLVNLPLALIGGILAIYITESPSTIGNTLALVGLGGRYTPPVISIASLVGFITLFGIAVRNGILLVNHYHHLIHEEGAGLTEAVVKGSLERLSPILMTALTAALALVPIALKGDRPGSEILAPLSVVILGGLLTSTLLNLVIVPAGYLLLQSSRTKDDTK